MVRSGGRRRCVPENATLHARRHENLRLQHHNLHSSAFSRTLLVTEHFFNSVNICGTHTVSFAVTRVSNRSQRKEIC